MDINPRITLLFPAKALAVGGISPLSPRQDDHLTEVVGKAVVLLLSQGNAKGLGWDPDTVR